MIKTILILALLLSILSHAQEFQPYQGRYAQEFDKAHQDYQLGHYESALNEFVILATMGDKFSQFMVGNMYHGGKGVPQDFNEAIKWYQLAADQGFVLGQSALGFMNENGQGFSQDYNQAIMWYQLAADQGYLDAQEAANRLLNKITPLQSQPPAVAANSPLTITPLESPPKSQRDSAPLTITPLENQPPAIIGDTRNSASNRSGSTGGERIAFKGLQGAIVGGFLALVVGLFLIIKALAKKAAKAAAPKVEHLRKATIPKARELVAKGSAAIGNFSKTEEQKVLEIDDDFFEAASNEILTKTQSKGLWLKSLSIAEGSEEKQKAIYIRLRAKQLSDAKG